jgi:hypothetical protein
VPLAKKEGDGMQRIKFINTSSTDQPTRGQRLIYLCFVVFIIIVTLLLASGYSKAETRTFLWDYPDLEANADLAGYRIYQAETSGGHEIGSDFTIKDVLATVNELVLETNIELAVGSWYFVITAYDATGNESGPSNEVFYKVEDTTPPDAPPNFRMKIEEQVTFEPGEYSVTFTKIEPTPEPLAVVIASPSNYRIARLNVGDDYYIDRLGDTHVLTSIPDEIFGGDWILSRNGDKMVQAENHLNFSISKPSIVYVAYDSRAISPPNWLREFELTPLKIGVSEEMRHFVTYKKGFDSGSVSLGGNRAAGSEFPAGVSGANYTVIIKS